MLRNFLYLLLVFCTALLAAGLAWIYYELNPSPSVDGWDLFGDGFAILFFFCLVLFIGVIWWTIKVIGDVRRNWMNKRYRWSNGLLLLVAYSPLIFFAVSNLFSHLHWAIQRNLITKDVSSYKLMTLSEKHFIRNVETTTHSCIIYATNGSLISNEESDKPFRFSDSKFHFADGKMSQLEVYSLSDSGMKQLFDYDLTLDTSGVWNSIAISGVGKCIWHRSNDQHYIEWFNPCIGTYRHVLHGYQEMDRSGGGSKPLYFVDADMNEWSIFYTESKARNFSKMYIAKIGKHTEHVYRIDIEKQDRNKFDHEQIRGLYTSEKQVFVLSQNGILTFEL